MDGVEFNGGSNITFNDVHVTCLNDNRFELYGGYCNAKLEGNPTGLSMRGGEVGPSVDNDAGCVSWLSSGLWGNSLSLDSVTFHDNVNLPGGHSECLMIRGGDGIAIRNSEFLRCNVFSIFFTCWPGNGDCSSAPAPKNVLIENNYFGPALSTTA